MRVACLLASVVLSCPAKSYSVLELDRFSVEYFDIADKRDLFWDKLEAQGGEDWEYGAALRFDVNLIRTELVTFYWNNMVHMAASEAQVRETGWQWEFGLNLGNYLEFFSYHHSQHFLDYGDDKPRTYPLENWHGVRLIFYDRRR